jgi:hypothetical protein
MEKKDEYDKKKYKKELRKMSRRELIESNLELKNQILILDGIIDKCENEKEQKRLMEQGWKSKWWKCYLKDRGSF